MIALLLAAFLSQGAQVSGLVVDSTGAPLPGALVTITVMDSAVTVTAAADGRWSGTAPAGTEAVSVRVTFPGFSPVQREVKLPQAAALTTELRPQGITEQISVSAEAASTRLSVDSSVTTIDRSSIASAPAVRLDDQLRVVPGFSLFRRTSSSVANPTTQGVTLRGMSASGASRTLVVSDDMPLNDPFGGWVYWDRIPLTALQRVDVLRGGSGDLHGNDALGGVIRLTTRTSRGAEVLVDGGSLGSRRISGYGGISHGGLTAGASAEYLTTDGYVVVAPDQRGTIDVPADSTAGSGLGWLGGTRGALQGVVRGGYFSEDRGNGTPAQVNATITRWGGGGAHGVLAGGVWEVRGDVSATNYRQTFSAVAAGRASERLTSLQWVDSTGGGFTTSWVRQANRLQGLIAYTNRSVRADLEEASFSLTGVQSAITTTRARQRGDGVIGQVRYTAADRVTLDAGVRADWWQLENLTTPADDTIGFFAPRVGATFAITPDITLRGAYLTGFRTPTMNELYRSFRVGNTTTQANANLDPEKSRGPEIALTVRKASVTARGIFYATWLDGAIYNRTISSTPTAIVRQRDNGDAKTVGSELELEWRLVDPFAVTTGWAFNDATFTSGELAGKRTPQVPRASGTIGFRVYARQFTASANFRVIGDQYDDDRNDFQLDSGSLFDARAGWRWSRRLELFGAIENAFDQEIDTGKTPIRTIGAPRVARAGITLRFD
jgi:outer membrane receptor protein involved in Fe transport